MKMLEQWKYWLMVGVFIASSCPLVAELAWEPTVLTLEAEPGQKEVTGTFRFTNTGKAPVRVTEVHSSCGCTVAKPSHEIIAPGESGELPAKMSLVDGQAGRAVSISVGTDEPSRPNYELKFNVTVAELVQMTPRLLFWKTGEAPKPKRAALRLRPGVQLLGAEVKGIGYTTNFEPGKDGETTLWVTPAGTAIKSQATLKLTLKQAGRPPVVTTLFLRVLE